MLCKERPNKYETKEFLCLTKPHAQEQIRLPYVPAWPEFWPPVRRMLLMIRCSDAKLSICFFHGAVGSDPYSMSSDRTESVAEEAIVSPAFEQRD